MSRPPDMAGSPLLCRMTSSPTCSRNQFHRWPPLRHPLFGGSALFIWGNSPDNTNVYQFGDGRPASTSAWQRIPAHHAGDRAGGERGPGPLTFNPDANSIFAWHDLDLL